MQTQTKKYPYLLLTLVASLGGFLFGFDMAVVSGVLPLLQKQFNLSASRRMVCIFCTGGLYCRRCVFGRTGRQDWPPEAIVVIGNPFCIVRSRMCIGAVRLL